MNDSLAGPVAGLNSSAYVAGVAVAVLRKALDLMQIQGEAVVTMIDAASVAADTTVTVPTSIADPLVGRRVDLLV